MSGDGFVSPSVFGNSGSSLGLTWSRPSSIAAWAYSHDVRLLFVSSTSVGGSGRSQRELASRLVRRGHDVLFLIDDESTSRPTRWCYDQLADASVRLAPTVLGPVLRWFESLPGRRVGQRSVGGLQQVLSPIPENAISKTLSTFRPDVVVGNSVVRLTWRKVVRACAAECIPTVLYVREETTLEHFQSGTHVADAIIANSRSLAVGVEQRQFQCEVIPSVIDVDVTRVESSRTVALLVNPIPSHGIDLVWQLAARLPDVSFVLQESWPLTPDQTRAIAEHQKTLPNVQSRGVAAPSCALFNDARVLLLPHLVDNRPRVVAEVQANGIPVVASDLPGIAEAVGPGGLLIDPAAIEGWYQAIRQLWEDADAYVRLADAALEHSKRPEIDADAVTTRVEAVLVALVARRGGANGPESGHL